ncbi:MAG: glycosyltransferase family 9 protein [Candidatus Binataceae bacterium]|nr:glycosyltransferase family 9 protein [Candidatus Binataceae bacterium]
MVDQADLSGGRMLIIFPGALGDLICAAPAMRALARRHADATVDFMARAELARFAAEHRVAARGHSRAYSIDRREVAQLFDAARPIAAEARAFFGAFAQVYSFFAAADAGFRDALAAATAGRATCYPFRPPGLDHVAIGYLRAIGADSAAAPVWTVELRDDQLARAAARLAAAGLEPHNFLLILPGSGSPAKNWPAESFAAVTDSLVPRMRPLVILGPAEEAIAPIFAARGLAIMRELELGEVAAIARLASGFIGNDSGVTHLAAAAGAPGIAIFGPTDPERWRPIGRVIVMRHVPLAMLEVGAVAVRLAAVIAESLPDGPAQVRQSGEK